MYTALHYFDHNVLKISSLKHLIFCYSKSENIVAKATDIFLLSPTSQDHCVMSKQLDSKTHLTVQVVSVTASRRFAMMAILLAFHD